MLIEGNDLRLIDVAVLSRLPLVHVRSYHDLFWIDRFALGSGRGDAVCVIALA
jgi:hypothetical protein